MIGAASNTLGLSFTATGAGAGTGTATQAIPTFQYVLTELYGVSVSAGTQGTSANAYSTTLGAPSFTPTNNNASGGNFVWLYSCKAEQDPGQWTSGLFPQTNPNFTLLSADIAWSGGTQYVTGGNTAASIPQIAMGYVQATSAAIVPSFVSPNEPSGDHWNSIAVAFKLSSGAGTAPSGAIFIRGIQHFSTNYFPGSGNWMTQVPAQGNLRVLQCNDPNLNAQIISDTEGNTYTSCGVGTGFWYCANTGQNPNLGIICNGGGTDGNLSWRFFDIANALVAPFDSAQISNEGSGSVSSVTSFTASPSYRYRSPRCRYRSPRSQ